MWKGFIFTMFIHTYKFVFIVHFWSHYGSFHFTPNFPCWIFISIIFFDKNINTVENQVSYNKNQMKRTSLVKDTIRDMVDEINYVLYCPYYWGYNLFLMFYHLELSYHRAISDSLGLIAGWILPFYDPAR